VAARADKAVDFDVDVARSRAAFGALVGVPAESVAISAGTSQPVGLVAANLPDGVRVLSLRPSLTDSACHAWPLTRMDARHDGHGLP
jgi:hypothetical protein